MKNQLLKKACLSTLIFLMLFCCSCAFGNSTTQPSDKTSSTTGEQDTDETQDIVENQDFAKAHDEFKTVLASKDNDSDPIPDPPNGVFDLVKYPSKVGDLAAYVSCDPGDGQKHPMIIWVVGGWGNGIDDFPFTYPEWDNDQTGSAFWQAGILTMYPSFRGGSGNPGYYETLFGEVDDIVSAYEYAASLPYVDKNRIYLGGHSTGGTRVLLAAEYTDKFRAVFGFGAVDRIEKHNQSQFTFDTSIEEEYKMRSPIYWLDNVKTPTFLIEGSDGNSSCLENIEQASKNDNIHCYILDGEDHFSVLAPITQLLAKKIIADTGKETNISITQDELEEAMEQEQTVPEPVMRREKIAETEVRFLIPFIWEMEKDYEDEGNVSYYASSSYDGENAWDLSTMYINSYKAGEDLDLQFIADSNREDGYDVNEVKINGLPAVKSYKTIDSDGTKYRNCSVAIQKDDIIMTFDLYCHNDFGKEAEVLFEKIAESIFFK